MTRRPWLWLVSLAITPILFAQDGRDPEPSAPLAPQRLAVTQQADIITRMARAGNHANALNHVARLLALLDGPDSADARAACLPIDGARAVGVIEWLQITVAGWPDEAQALYRKRYDSAAAKLLAVAVAGRDKAAALAVWRHYRNTSSAPAAAALLAGLLREEGRPAEARRFRELALRHPRTPAADCGRLTLQAGLDAVAAGEWRAAQARIEDLNSRFAGARIEGLPARTSASDFLAARLAAQRSGATGGSSATAIGDPPDWSHINGGPGHDRVWPAPVGADVLVASFPLTSLLGGADEPSDRPVRPEEPATAAAELKANWATQAAWPAHYPTVWRGRLVLADERSLALVRMLPPEFAGRARTETVGRTGTGDSVLGEFGIGPAAAGHPYPRIAAVGIDAAFAAMGPSMPVNMNSWAPPGINRIRAFALDADGDDLWRFQTREARVANERRQAELEKSFLEPPLVVGGRLYSVVRGRGGCSLIALAAGRDAPRMLFYTPLGTAKDPPAAEEYSNFNYMPTVLAADGTTVYAAAHHGFVAAVDALDGTIVWFHDYIGAREWKGIPDGQLALSAPILHDGRLYVLTADTRELLCLSAADGSLIWKTNAPHMRLLVGRAGDRLVAAGDASITVCSAADGKPIWTADFAQDPPPGTVRGPGPLSGAPALAAGVLHYPGQLALIGLDVAGPAPRETYRRDYRGLGNLLPYGGMLTAVSADQPGKPGTARVRIFSRWDDLAPRIAAAAADDAARPEALAQLAGLCERLRQDETALTLWRRAEALQNAAPRAEAAEPPDPRAARFRLLCRSAARMLNPAAADRFDPDGADRRLAEAWACTDKADERMAAYFLLLARLHEARGQFREAMSAYGRIMAAEPLRRAPVALGEPDEPTAEAPAWTGAVEGQRRLLRRPAIAAEYAEAARTSFLRARGSSGLDTRTEAVAQYPLAAEAADEMIEIAAGLAGRSGPLDAAGFLEGFAPLLEPAAAAPVEIARAEHFRRAGRIDTARRLLNEIAQRHGGLRARLPGSAEPTGVREWVAARLAGPDYADAADSSGRPTLSAMPAWRLALMPEQQVVVPEVVPGAPEAAGFLVAGPESVAFHRFDDLRAGRDKPAWTRTVAGKVHWAAQVADRLVLVHPTGVLCVDAAGGATVHWSLGKADAPAADDAAPAPAPAALNGTERCKPAPPDALFRHPALQGSRLCLLAGGRRILIRDVLSGADQWRSDAARPVTQRIILTEWHVLAVTFDRSMASSVLEAFDRRTGTRRERKLPSGSPPTAAQVSGEYLACRAERRHVVQCLRLSDLQVAWEQAVGPKTGGEVAAYAVGGRFAVFTDGMREPGRPEVVSLEAPGGRIVSRVRWDPDSDSPASVPRYVRLEDNRLLAAGDGRMVCRRLTAPDAADDMELLWAVPTGVRDADVAPQWAGGRLWYLTPADGAARAEVRLLDPRTGQSAGSAPCPAGPGGRRSAVIVGRTLLVEGGDVAGFELK